MCKVRSIHYRTVLRRLYAPRCRRNIVQLYASDALNGNCVVTLTRGVNEVAEAAAGYGSGVIYTHRPKKVIRSRLSPAECQTDGCLCRCRL